MSDTGDFMRDQAGHQSTFGGNFETLALVLKEHADLMDSCDKGLSDEAFAVAEALGLLIQAQIETMRLVSTLQYSLMLLTDSCAKKSAPYGVM